LGFGSVVLGTVSGVIVGLISGYAGGWIDTIFMRVVDVFMPFGLLLLAILVMAILGTGLVNTIIAIGIFMFIVLARFTRGQVLAVKEHEYVDAARAIGARRHRIVFRHILPNIVSPLVVIGTLRLGEAILAEASLSFLGLGPSPPTPSWGLMVNEGLNVLRSSPWISLMPGLAIVITVLGFNLFGDGIRDALHPRLREG
jgi:peptide/nickel transport system permease protein